MNVYLYVSILVYNFHNKSHKNNNCHCAHPH